MSTRKDLKGLTEAYTGVSSVPMPPSNMLGKPVIVTMDMPGSSLDIGHDHEEHHCDHNHEVDSSEINMAAADLHKIAEYAPKIKELVESLPSLEGWVASKITKASDYISSVFHYLEYENVSGQGNMYTSCGAESHCDNTMQ
jgi:hypothetical protein